MADWTDGPEYAPTQRPDVFVVPDAPPLGADAAASDPESTPADEISPSTQPPSAWTPPDAIALDAVTPPAPPGRDPRTAFEVVSTPLTLAHLSDHAAPVGEPILDAPPPADPAAPSAWGHVHASGSRTLAPTWTPDQPFGTAPPPPPTNIPGPNPGWPAPQVNPEGFPSTEPPPWQAAPPPGMRPVTIPMMFQAATPGVMICLALATLVTPLSLVLLLLASVLAVRVRHRRRIIARIFTGAIGTSVVLGALSQIGRQGTFYAAAWYQHITGWAQVAALILVVVVPLVMGDALRRHEPPEDLP